MFLTNEEVANRLEDPNNLIRRRENDRLTRQLARVRLPEYVEDGAALVPLHNGGRRKGDANMDSDMRLTVAVEARTGQSTVAEVAEKHNVSQHHVRELAEGKHSHAQGSNAELVSEINKQLEEPHTLAVKKLTKALLAIDEEKLKTQKPKDLASIAAQLSRVAENTAPLKHEDDKLSDCKLVVYAPSFKQENHYETVEVARAIHSSDS